MVLSVLIPTLNEETALAVLLEQLRAQRDISLEIIIADGGSQDATLTVAEKFGARVVRSPSGRGRQLNQAIATIDNEYLLILHADSQLPHNRFLAEAWEDFEKAFQINWKTAGHFAIRFVRSTRGHTWAFRYPEEKSRTGRLHTINGDQGLLISKTFLSELGGYSEELPFFEDQIIADKIFKAGRFILLPGTLLTSGRRFEMEGFHKRYTLMSIITGLYWAGVHGYFDLAKDVYRQQRDTEKLQLWPFIAAMWKLMDQLGFEESAKAWYWIGRYVRQHSWQLFFFFDVAFRYALGPNRYPFTRFHDWIFWPITNNRFFDIVNTVLCFAWFMLILGPYLWLTEKIEVR